jgi:hypothetical protein
MNFLTAIKHAAIGYGIRRKPWEEGYILHLNYSGELEWLACGSTCPLLDGDTGWDLTEHDIKSKDWETI